MANTAATVVSEYFKEKHDVTIEPEGEKENLLIFSVRGKNKDKDVIVSFSDDNTAASIYTVLIDRIPEDKAGDVLVTLNALNRSYPWAKFVIEKDGAVVVSDEAVIDLDTCGEEIDRCIIQVAEISDEAYPVIMKAIYG